ncbi:hypothetical protein CVT25_000056 [Psilocybe cyanescens]|uniref:Uncharacterized protein n=1 Tax=Psilocybe cyanescens TaxID=93625 RepID=A0A409X8H6_PSICY|nr:hypothetical protein CVT25_000056 [Psilocybe cyanescens]
MGEEKGLSTHNKALCIKRESNPRRVELTARDGNDPGYHYPINAWTVVLWALDGSQDTIADYLYMVPPNFDP